MYISIHGSRALISSKHADNINLFVLSGVMFKIQFVRVALNQENQYDSKSLHDIFLDVKAENESKELFKLGPFSFSQSHSEDLEGLCYVAASPIRVRAFSKSLLLASDLGVHFLYSHLHSRDDKVIEGSLAFGTRRKETPTIRVFFKLSRVKYRFRVVLEEARCCFQDSWIPGKDHLKARVKGVSYDLGWFSPFEHVASTEAFSLSFVSKTTASFFVERRLCWRNEEIGKLVFIPGDEVRGSGEESVLFVKEDHEDEAKECKETEPNMAVVTIGDRYEFKLSVHREYVAPTLPSLASVIPSNSAQDTSEGNSVSFLVDGLQTFEQYYHSLMQARHSISILAWELSLSFGLITVERGAKTRPRTTPAGSHWISLEDVLLEKALNGVTVRVVVWRHQLLTYVNRFLYLGEFSIEAEVRKLIQRGQSMGVAVHMVKTSSSASASSYLYSDPHKSRGIASIVFVIVGNPSGVLSSHHEKLVLIDPECSSDHGTAFVGGFDIARGRYDQSSHLIPQPYYELNNSNNNNNNNNSSSSNDVDSSESSALEVHRIRFLWHDVQVMLQGIISTVSPLVSVIFSLFDFIGPVLQKLHLHFAQRWKYAFTNDIESTKLHVLPRQVSLKSVPGTQVTDHLRARCNSFVVGGVSWMCRCCSTLIDE